MVSKNLFLRPFPPVDPALEALYNYENRAFWKEVSSLPLHLDPVLLPFEDVFCLPSQQFTHVLFVRALDPMGRGMEILGMFLILNGSIGFFKLINCRGVLLISSIVFFQGKGLFNLVPASANL